MNDRHQDENNADLELMEELFFQALGKPVAERTAFLNIACPGNLQLRNSVKELLRVDGDRSGLIDTAPWSAEAIGMKLANRDVADPLAQADAIIGRYRLESMIGAGGMGTVWRARRADGQVDRPVALKLIRGGSNSRVAFGRFQLEERALSRLEHTNIARLYDGGTTEDGRPYFVMEYVDGVPITAYARQGNLTIEQRLALMHQLCDAVQYAHGSLILHRDIKPGNILVTADGTPKLLDFGIAKILEDPDSATGGVTMTEEAALTPQYASPEQIRGERLSIATDVYSLGVVLYELLTDRTPYQLKTRSRYELERTILEHEVARPSAVVGEDSDTPPSRRRMLSRRLRGDLDTVCMTALQKSPTQRYRSVLELGEDIRRHVEGLPLLARPPGLLRRLNRFVRRRRSAIIASIAGAVLATALLSVYVVRTFLVPGWQDDHVRQARLAVVGDQANTVIYNLLFFGFNGWTPESAFAAPGDDQWAMAAEHYTAAVEWGDVSEQVQGEESMLRLAYAARESPDACTAILDALPRPAPLTTRYIQSLVEQRERVSMLEDEWDKATEFDLRCLGFVSFFMRDQLTAIDSWNRLALDQPDPAVEAILGYVSLALNEPELAYGRLLSAYRAYPESDTLAVYMADAAVRAGDLSLAEELLYSEDISDHNDVHRLSERVESMFLLATGDEDAALEILCEDVAIFNAVAGVQLARHFEVTQGVESAIQALAGQVPELRENDYRRATLEYYINLMDSWWLSLDQDARRDIHDLADQGDARALVADFLQRYAFAVHKLQRSPLPRQVPRTLLARSRWASLAFPIDPSDSASARAEMLEIAARFPYVERKQRPPGQCTGR